MDLPEKYHPRRFEDLVGQADVIERLQRKLSGGGGMKLLLHGPSGTGKSTLARIVAQSIFCEQRARSGSPCRICHACLDVERGHKADQYKFINAPDHGRVVPMSDMLKKANDGYKFVAIIDEAHQLETKAAELLLSQTDLPPTDMTLILCTTNLDLLKRRSSPLVDRFDAIFIGKPTFEELLSKLKSVADAEDIDIASPAAQKIVGACEGSVRSLLKIFQAFIEAGGTEGALQRATEWRSADQAALEFLELCASAHGFESVVSQLQTNSLEALRAGVENQLARLLIASSTGRPMQGADQVIQFAVRAAAQRNGCVAAKTWEQLVDIWKPLSTTATYAQLVRMASMTYRLIAGSSRLALQANELTIPAVQTIRRLRGDDERYLSKPQFQKLWHAASSYSTAYGDGIRMLVQVQHSKGETAAATMSRLTHGIAANYARYQSFLPPLAWMYLNYRTQAGLPVSSLSLSFPASMTSRVQTWVARSGERLMRDGSVYSLASPMIAHSPDLQFQEKALREFAAFLDPTILKIDANGQFAPLIDLLGVRVSSRRALGPPFGRYTIRLSHSLVGLVKGRLDGDVSGP